MEAAPATAGEKRSGFFLLPTATLWQREIVRFYRQRNRIIGALPVAACFLVRHRLRIGPSFRGGGVVERGQLSGILLSGTLILIMLFTAIFSTISIIEDRREGFLQSVLVAPISRGSIVCGKILGGTTSALLQGLIFLLLAPFVGIHISPERVLVCLGTLFVVGFGLTGSRVLVAWPMESTQGFHAIMNVFLIPLWLMSGALFPATNPHSWDLLGRAPEPTHLRRSGGPARALHRRSRAFCICRVLGPSIGCRSLFGLVMYAVASFFVQRKST